MVAQNPARRIALLWPSGHLDRCPPAINLAIALARAGWEVDLYAARNATAPETHISENGVHLVQMPGVAQHFHEPVLRMTTRFLCWVNPRIRGRAPAVIIGIGIRGLIVAACLSMWLRIPSGYYSLELYPSKESRGWRRMAKMLERWAHRHMRFSISQDDMRAQMLADDNGIDRGSIDLLPVAAPGPPLAARDTFLRERLRLQPDQRILLYAGTLLADFSAAADLVEAAQSWPPGWVLVLHAGHRAPERAYDALRVLDRLQRARFSTEPVSYADLPRVMASADIGLALYRRTDDNMFYMGLASGKLSEYLRCSVPVIASDLPGMADLIRETGAGIIVKSAADIVLAAETIFSHEERFRTAAGQCFGARLALERHLPALLTRLSVLAQERPGRPD